ncbi:MAG: aminodeoxychorismate synthase component I [Actinobacteria bacterium]|nr:aminodeoxychorismate synthase component I [Actinomycetota bacterium]
MRVLIIDNYDSYTYNLAQLIATITESEPRVIRNDEWDWRRVESEGADAIVLSPGPGTAARAPDVGVCADVIRRATTPVLGVCLGHQAIAYLEGGTLRQADRIVHGGRSRIWHDGDPLFAGIPSGFSAVRYHSLEVARLPSSLMEIARTDDGILMGLRHRSRPLWGVQFHPESVWSEHGRRLLENFLSGATARLPERATIERRASRPRRRPARAEPATVLEARWRETKADVSPEAVMSILGGAEHAFWLDSARTDAAAGRYSYFGLLEGPRSRAAHFSIGRDPAEAEGRSVFDFIDAQLEAFTVEGPLPPFAFCGGLVGYLGYEAKTDLGAPSRHRSPYPDAALLFVDRFFAFDHHEGRLYAVALDEPSARDRSDTWLAGALERIVSCGSPYEAPAGRWRVSDAAWDLAADAYLERIARCQALMRAGESYEICLTTQIRVAGSGDPLGTYAVLRHENPAPYGAYLKLGPLAVLSSSPELFLEVEGDRTVRTKPIKGTAARGVDARADAAAIAELRSSTKTVAENLMITDVLRNDLGRVAEPGSVAVPAFLDVETYATVHQLVSTITARLRPDLTVVDALRSTFPGGSMTGAPRLRTMQIIDALEASARGVYAGAIGYVALTGESMLSIAIRTIVCDEAGAAIGVGGAITVDSDPLEELEEAHLKARVLLRSLELASTGDASG